MRVLATISLFVACSPLLALLLLGQHGVVPMLNQPVWLAATARTLLIASCSVPIALLLGVPAAMALWGAPTTTRRSVIAICALPILTPPSWSASGLQFLAGHAGFADAHAAVLIAAHAAPASSLAFLVVYAFLDVANPMLLRVAAASGASPAEAWRISVLPHLAMAMAVAAAAAFAASVGLTIVDTELAPAFQPTLGGMVSVAVLTADSQTAAAALVLALLALGPLALVWCVSLLRRQ
jgi:ABC-type spermidine/putrescine transport system permease subunit II